MVKYIPYIVYFLIFLSLPVASQYSIGLMVNEPPVTTAPSQALLSSEESEEEEDDVIAKRVLVSSALQKQWSSKFKPFVFFFNLISENIFV